MPGPSWRSGVIQTRPTPLQQLGADRAVRGPSWRMSEKAHAWYHESEEVALERGRPRRGDREFLMTGGCGEVGGCRLGRHRRRGPGTGGVVGSPERALEPFYDACVFWYSFHALLMAWNRSRLPVSRSGWWSLASSL